MRQGKLVQHFETERLRKDGRQIFVSLTLSPLRDQRGRLIGFSTIARDITRRKQLEREVERSKPDLVLADINLPGRSGLDLIRDIRVLAPRLPVLVLSMHDEAVFAERVLRVEASR